MNLKRMLVALMVIMVAFCIPATAQDKVVTGKVTDAKDGSALPGATVKAKGTNIITQTDNDGVFKIKVPATATTLVVSYSGFTEREIAISGDVVNVKLEAASGNLNEVVVVGYGTQRKRDVSASITKIGEKDLNPGPVTSPLQQIAGKAAGVQITQVGNEPGVAPNIRIRGITSLSGGNDPLVVVDGIQGGTDLLNQLSPNEIESIEVLKDASATAIYGSRGAAGVLLVTTKRSKAGQTFVEYSGSVALESVPKFYENLNASEWRATAAARGLNMGNIDFGGNTDWVKEVTRNGTNQNHNIAFGGGTGNLNYRASLTAIMQQGVITKSAFDNYIGRLQFVQKALDEKLTITGNVNFSVLNNRWNNAGNVLAPALRARPTDPIFKTNIDPTDRRGPYFIDNTVFSYLNPYARANEIIDGRSQTTVFASLRTDLAITKNLTASWFGSWNRRSDIGGYYEAPRTTISNAITESGFGNRSTNFRDEKLTNLILNYKKTVGDHFFNADFVYEWQKAIYEGASASGRGFLNDITSFNNLSASDITKARSGDASSYKNDRTLASFLVRANYSYLGKYAITASIRRDGASVFGINNKWANFPAISASWRINKEKFMQDVSFIDELNLRVGYGVTGNQGGLGPLNSVELATQSGSAFFLGNLIPVFAINQNANPDLRWETKRQTNFGLDFAFFKRRLSGTVDYFVGDTKDLLFSYNVPQPPFPAPTIFANIGTIRNTGLELTLNYQLVKRRDLTINIGGNFTALRNTVKELSGSYRGIPLNTDTVRWGAGGTTGVASSDNGISYLIKGSSIGTFLLYRHVGVDAYGNQVLDDINKNGLTPLTPTSGDIGDRSPDRVASGQMLPKFTIGFTPSMSYKNLDVSMVIRGAYGHKIYNAFRATMSSLSQIGQQNVLKSAVTDNFSNVTVASDYWLEDGSWTRLENFTIGYRVNTKVKYISSLRFSITAQNLFVITKYSGPDPELRLDGGAGSGIDFGTFPRTRNIAFGVNVNLK